jgi:hypothetical protein
MKDRWEAETFIGIRKLWILLLLALFAVEEEGYCGAKSITASYTSLKKHKRLYRSM